MSAIPDVVWRAFGDCPNYFDIKIAGWWVWGLCQWIGTGWCAKAFGHPSQQLPHLGDAGRGIHREGDVDYAAGNPVDVWTNVSAWATDHGDHPLLRIALCGYEGATAPKGWTGSQGSGDGRTNANRERIWFSPACLPIVDAPCDGPLFTRGPR